MYDIHPIAVAFHALQRPILDAAHRAGEPRPCIPTVDQPAALSSATDVLARIATAAQTAAAELAPQLAALEAEAKAAAAALEAAEDALRAARQAAYAARSAATQAKNTVAVAPMVECLLGEPPALREMLRAVRGDFQPGPERDRLVDLGLVKNYEKAGAIGRTPEGWSVLCILRQCVGPA